MKTKTNNRVGTHRENIYVVVQTYNATNVTFEMLRHIRHEIISAITELNLGILSALHSACRVGIMAENVKEIFVRITAFALCGRYQTGTCVIVNVSYRDVASENKGILI